MAAGQFIPIHAVYHNAMILTMFYIDFLLACVAVRFSILGKQNRFLGSKMDD